MDCPIAVSLLEKLAIASNDYFDAADKLANVVGKHESFEEAKRHAENMREKCRAAHLALEQHSSEHGCRSRGTGIP